jgi:putative ABC transport system permease protein
VLDAVLVVVVTGLGVMVSIYNSMAERRREVAIMRSLGARCSRERSTMGG